MKIISNSTAETPEAKVGTQFPRLHLTTAFLLMMMVILFFIWEVYRANYAVHEQLPVEHYSALSVTVIVLMLIVSLMAWLTTIRTLRRSQKALVKNDLARRKTEESLRLSETYFRNLLDNANDLFYTTDLEGNFTSLNKAGKVIAGYTHEEAVNLNIADVVAPEYLEFAQQMTMRKIKGELPTTYELEILTKDQRRVAMEISTRLIYEANQPIGVQGIARDVTARKLDEAALRTSENKYRSLVDSLPAIVYVAEPEPPHAPIYVSPNVESLGYKQEDWYAVSDFWISILHPEDRERVLQQTEEALKAGRENEYEYRIIAADGSVVWLHDRGRFVQNEDGQRLYWQGVMLDITARKQAEEAIRNSERNYRFLSEGIIYHVWTALPDGKLDYVNQRTIKYFGCAMDDIIGDGWRNFVHPDDLPNCLKNWNHSVATGDFYRVEFRLKDADGIYRWYAAQATAGRDADGNIIKWFGTSSDIDNEKQANVALRRSEELFRLLTTHSPVIIFQSDINGNCLFVNDYWCNLTGLTFEESLGTGYAKAVHPDDIELMSAEWEKSKREEKEFSFVYRLVSVSGEIYDIWGRSVIYRSQDDGIIGFIGTGVDITKDKRAKEDLQKSVSLLASTLEATDNAILAIDLKGRIVSYNKNCLEMWNIPETEIEVFGQVRELYAYLDQLKDPENFKLKSKELAKQPKTPNYMVFEFKDGRVYERYCQPQMIGGEVIGLVLSFRDITERKHSEERLLHDAFHDSLTGLANRALFTDHLRLRIERGKRDHSAMFAVLFLDFDRFKVINDSLGHAEGDALLILIARRLESVLRSSDVVARLGGDEFTILLGELDEDNEAIQIARRIQENLKFPFNIGGGEIFMSASIGIALSSIGHTNAEDMLRDADIAMYCAKANGKACYQVFDQAMHDRALKQLQIETEIRQAFERGEFCLYYQPIFVIETNKLAGFEALIRWDHPERGTVSPVEFIPVAEENGLILPLGRWILFESCRQMRQWQDKNPAAASLKLSVNLSCKQFLQPDLVEQVTAALISTRLEPRCLKLEITESHLMENSVMSVKMMTRLRELGVELSLDDFGTGYSSLSYLHRLPVNYLKIDRSFVSRMTESDENSEIVNTIIKLAQSMKMKVIAEGIETSAQLEQLKRLNCEYGQGYFYSKPLEAEAAGAFIDEMSANPLIHTNDQIINLELNM